MKCKFVVGKACYASKKCVVSHQMGSLQTIDRNVSFGGVYEEVAHKQSHIENDEQGSKEGTLDRVPDEEIDNGIGFWDVM